MLRSTHCIHKAGELKSAIFKTNGNALNGYAVVRSRSMVMAQNKGLSSGFLPSLPLQRLFNMPNTGQGTRENVGGVNEALNQTAKTLSPHWRPFALADGGVLFVHPSQKQVMQWSAAVMEAERKSIASDAATPTLTAREHQTATKMRQLVEDNTIEHTPLSQWRRKHMWALIDRQVGLKPGDGSVSTLEPKEARPSRLERVNNAESTPLYDNFPPSSQWKNTENERY